MRQLNLLLYAGKYEFLMQIRRPLNWAIPLVLWLCVSWNMWHALTAPWQAISLSSLLGSFLIPQQSTWPVAIGMLIADRLPRDRHYHVQDLFAATPARADIRFLGPYLGSTLAALLPFALCYWLNIGILFLATHVLKVWLSGLEAFASVLLPGILFVNAFSLICPAFIWTPLYRCLLLGYWLWGNMLSTTSTIPTLSGTVLTPIGGTALNAFFGLHYWGNSVSTTGDALLSIALLVGLAMLIIAAFAGVQEQLQLRR
ncbi:hypothetical protein EPA93_09760 [Ktedonosporobacter rubrisoli]|uniref:Uncharacterized protein n=1 Tax=Ktedonosporobacter rubrisoli TaxID=2509675 RepID=A0A4P6JM04_KTERU|nr:hypothetical protein [Ktedonosporobacter rubrisoli]QBD76279.1 hypothetical protein EPA93_09760 [Ktedonosporobacter rubrisoli]